MRHRATRWNQRPVRLARMHAWLVATLTSSSDTNGELLPDP